MNMLEICWDKGFSEVCIVTPIQINIRRRNKQTIKPKSSLSTSRLRSHGQDARPRPSI